MQGFTFKSIDIISTLYRTMNGDPKQVVFDNKGRRKVSYDRFDLMWAV